jgi:hypothetical protein
MPLGHVEGYLMEQRDLRIVLADGETDVLEF